LETRNSRLNVVCCPRVTARIHGLKTVVLRLLSI
jgi:hypothetical protein